MKKKPELSDFGLTQNDFRKIIQTKKLIETTTEKNKEIDKNAPKIGWISYIVIACLSLIIAICTNNMRVFSISVIIIGPIISLGITAIYKKTKSDIPTLDITLENKYNNFINAVMQYQSYQKQGVTENKPQRTKKDTQIKKESFATLNSKITEQQTNTNLNNTADKHTNYEIGMIVRHSTYGIGRIIHINEDNSVIDVYFHEKSNNKKFVVNLVKLEILEVPEKKSSQKNNETNTTKTENSYTKSVPIKNNDNENYNDNISITYKNSNIQLTKEQEEIFNKMLDVSLKFCVDLQIDDRKQIVGVGLINQEKLRYYITKKYNKLYVRFADDNQYILLKESNKDILLKKTKEVNDKFEKNPENYQLTKYKEEQKNIENTTKNTDDIFDTEEDSSEVGNKETPQQNTTIVYDNTIFSIEGETLVKCFEKQNKSSYEIPVGITTIAENAFANTTQIYTVNIPLTVTKIEKHAFKNCIKLRDLILPESIKEIGENAFLGCENLETIFCNTKAVKKLLINLPKHIEVVCLEF